MLVSLGRKSPSEPSLQDRLLDCHARIRRFCALARRLAEGAAPKEAAETAAALDRYFSIALPLHIADEEESLAPRLMRLGDATLTAFLDAMVAEHVEADAQLAELTARWREIAVEPKAVGCQATSSAAQWLALHLERHLVAEEQHVFPSLTLLPPAQIAAIVAELRAGRG
jgi:iron-sulfur cluster repair protein YtfE (RIC family)